MFSQIKIQLTSWSKSLKLRLTWPQHKLITMVNQCASGHIDLNLGSTLPYTDWWSSTLHGLGVRLSLEVDGMKFFLVKFKDCKFLWHSHCEAPKHRKFGLWMFWV